MQCVAMEEKKKIKMKKPATKKPKQDQNNHDNQTCNEQVKMIICIRQNHGNTSPVTKVGALIGTIDIPEIIESSNRTMGY